MKRAFLYGGQGAQRQGAGKDFYDAYNVAKHHYDTAPRHEMLKSLSFNTDEATLAATAHTQPVMVAYGVMLTKLLASLGMVPDGVCGLSVGEYAALYAAGVLSSDEAITTAWVRGRLMEEADAGCEVMMLAVVGSDEETVTRYLDAYRKAGLYAGIANINARDQLVLSGAKGVLNDVRAALKKEGIRSVPLRVSGAFHSPYMAPAQKELKAHFDTLRWQSPSIDMYLNVSGDKARNDHLPEAMIRQLVSPVRLDDNLRRMLDDGYEEFIELSPKPVLAKLVKALDERARVHTIDSVEAFKEWEATW